jgi:hypothetical protein
LEAAWQGTVHADGLGGFLFSPDTCTDGIAAPGSTPWPLITLEPGLNRWLQDLERPTATTLVGCLNPWGPWLRASRLASA